MKNKVNLKKCLIKIFIVTISLLFIYLILNIYEYNTYTKNYNKKISQILTVISEKYPEASQNELIEILNNNTSNNTNIFNKYGIDIENTSLINENDSNFKIFIIYNIVLLIMGITIITIIFLKYNLKREKDVKDITKCIEQINKKNYEIKIDSMSEDELSILKNEIYKTTIMLKETAENSKNDKIKLKQSLEDISHQLKTPLTSILIMLDNLLDDENMSNQTRSDFIRDIRREIISINFLVQAILKISKFDANTIEFIKSNTSLKEIVDQAIKKVSSLCDLKNIIICVQNNSNSDAIISCDFKWEVEAITNILKNCVEHSRENSTIIVKIEDNKMYKSLTIIDNGEGIDKNDLPHIFERFYKGKNSSPESIGIGLALEKTIIEKDNGTIYASSIKNKSTTFVIKYMI